MKAAGRAMASACLLWTSQAVSPAGAMTGGAWLEPLHARAVQSFREGRFPEAYGRFIELAESGHPASARYALFMCEHGFELFGKDWDCAQFQVDAWAQLAGVPAMVVRARPYAPAQRPRSAAVTGKSR